MKIFKKAAAFVVFMAASLVTANTMECDSSISFKTFPFGGQDAFWAHNPKNLDQKILLVPSCHIISLDYSRNDLQEEMKNADILISEGATGFETYEDMFREVVLFDSEDLRNCNVIKKGYFNVDCKPWPEVMKAEYKGELGKVAQFLEGHLKCSINDINPVFVIKMTELFFVNRQRPFAMDSQITKYYNQKGKEIIALEDRVSKLPNKSVLLGQLTEMSNIVNFSNDSDLPILFVIMHGLSGISRQLNHYLDLSDENKHKESIKSFEPMFRDINLNYSAIEEVEKQCSKDNKSWLPKLLETFDANPQKSIVVVLGAAFFPGLNTGILKLLSDKGFTFTSF